MKMQQERRMQQQALLGFLDQVNCLIILQALLMKYKEKFTTVVLAKLGTRCAIRLNMDEHSMQARSIFSANLGWGDAVAQI